jgi:DNA-binding transcriptional ArsR family regulator
MVTASPHLEYRSTQFTKTGRQAQAADLRRRRPEHVNRFVTVRTVTGVRRRGPGRIKDENLLPFATGHRCVCQARAVLGLALSIVSEHVVIFKAAVLVDDRRERRWIHYGLASASRNHRGRGPENEWRWARRRRESA